MNETLNAADIIYSKPTKSISDVTNFYKSKIESVNKDRSWLRWVIAGVISLGAIFIASLVAAQIITGAIALIVAGLVAVGGFYGFTLIKRYDPVIQKKIQNSVTKALIEEAQESTIETLTMYVGYLDQYLKYSKQLRMKVDTLIQKYKHKYKASEDPALKKEYLSLVDKLTQTASAINKIVTNSENKKVEFRRTLDIAKEKHEFVKETKDVVNFLQNSDSELDKLLVDESLNQLEKDFQEISSSIKYIAEDIDS